MIDSCILIALWVGPVSLRFVLHQGLHCLLHVYSALIALFIAFVQVGPNVLLTYPVYSKTQKQPSPKVNNFSGLNSVTATKYYLLPWEVYLGSFYCTPFFLWMRDLNLLSNRFHNNDPLPSPPVFHLKSDWRKHGKCAKMKVLPGFGTLKLSWRPRIFHGIKNTPHSLVYQAENHPYLFQHKRTAYSCNCLNLKHISHILHITILGHKCQPTSPSDKPVELITRTCHCNPISGQSCSF